jgi:alkylation response protein AidB-like acyl-CoA dehydrogenase
VDGEKQFVTSAVHADSYVISTAAPESAPGDPGRFSFVIVDRDRPGLVWGAPWTGMGMRGNESRSLRLEQVRIPRTNLLGELGDQIWYVFEVVAPYFLMAMSGTYLGLASAIVDITTSWLKQRTFAHSGESLADAPVLQHRLAEMWMSVESARQLVYHAARLGDAGDPGALAPLLASKAQIGDVVVQVANEAMTVCGGQAYQQNALLARFLRDARAAPIMSPTTDLLKIWTGRALLGRPLL